MITSQFAQKMAIPIILITVILTSSLFVEVASAQSSFGQALINVSSFGTISSPPLPPPIQSDLLPLTGLGGDYLISYAGGDAEVWLDSYAWGGDGNGGWVDRAKLRYPEYFACKLEFQFAGLSAPSLPPSELDLDKMDEVLGYFQSRGLKVIMDFQNPNFGDAINVYPAQAGFINDWVAVANHYKNERPDLRDTIAAYVIFEEPNSETLAALGGSRLAMMQRFAYTIQQIRAVDSTIPIVFPDSDQTYGYTTALYNQAVADIQSALTTYGLQNDPNIYFDVGHPYWWTPGEGVDNWVSTPEEKASFYTGFYQIYVDAFGASRCYVGETYANWNEGDDAMQARWLTAIINNLYSKGIGFSLLSVLGVGGVSTFNKTLACIDASNYHP